MLSPPSRSGPHWVARYLGRHDWEVAEMASNEVRSVGFGLALQPNGSHQLRVWWMLDGGGRMQEAVYSDLTWLEAWDVIDAELVAHRPGWAIGGGWAQPPLPFAGE